MLRKLVLLITAATALQATAGSFDYLPSSTAAEKELRTMMESGDFKHALMAWQSGTGKSNFAQTQSGVATWSYLIYQNGLQFVGLQTLIQSTKPNLLPAQLLQLWTKELKSSPLIQKSFVLTTGDWKTIVYNDTFNIHIRSKTDIARQFAYVQKLPADNINQRARVLWQIANQAPLINQVDLSLKAIKLLQESGQTLIGQDLILMTEARTLYQKGEIDAALSAYQQIPKSSDLWLDAVEERAWAHLRKDDYDKAMGVVITALNPVLAPLARPETFFLANLMSLKTCDYKRLFNTSELFKTRQRDRLQDMQELAQKGSNRNTAKIFEKFETSGVNIEAAGAQVGSLPHGIFRDRQFVHAMESRRQLLGEIKKGTQLIEDSKTLGSDGDLSRILAQAKTKADRFRLNANSRARTLAQQEVKEYKVVLNKMHIIEAQVIERLHLDDNLKGQRSKLSKNDDQGDVLVFPYTSDEVWMDELDNYKARVKDCPTLKGASL